MSNDHRQLSDEEFIGRLENNVAFALLIYKTMRQKPVGSWETFIADNPILCTGKSMLSNWYSDELLANSLSRRLFVPPDKAKMNLELLLIFFE